MDQGAALFRQWLDGNEKAMDRIFEMYHDPLILFINRYVHNIDVAEDLAADSFAKLILSPKKYNFSVSLKTYLFLIGKSKALDYLRSQRFSSDAEIQSLSTPSPETLLIAEQEKQQLYQALSRLKPEYQNALFLVYFEELSYKEAAKVMKKSVKQIENLVRRGRLSLKESYEVIQK